MTRDEKEELQCKGLWPMDGQEFAGKVNDEKKIDWWMAYAIPALLLCGSMFCFGLAVGMMVYK